MNLFSPIFAKVFGGLAVLALVIAGVQTIRVSHLKKIVATLRIDLDQVKSQRDTERANHQSTKDAYRQAQAEAARMEKERIARDQARQERINDERRASYDRRIAAARATADRLHTQTGAGSGSAPDCQPVPGAQHPAGADETARCDEFSLRDRLIATEQAIQLDELITRIEQQAVR